MRVLVLALAILLLPLRGWLGDAMALEVLRQQVVMTTASSAHADHAMHAAGATEGMAHDHGAHAQAGAHEGAAASPASDCQSTCTHCQLCHNVAMTVWPEVPMLAEAPRAAPALEPVAFASAEPAPGFKPPIS